MDGLQLLTRAAIVNVRDVQRDRARRHLMAVEVGGQWVWVGQLVECCAGVAGAVLEEGEFGGCDSAGDQARGKQKCCGDGEDVEFRVGSVASSSHFRHHIE